MNRFRTLLVLLLVLPIGARGVTWEEVGKNLNSRAGRTVIATTACTGLFLIAEAWYRQSKIRKHLPLTETFLSDRVGEATEIPLKKTPMAIDNDIRMLMACAFIAHYHKKCALFPTTFMLRCNLNNAGDSTTIQSLFKPIETSFNKGYNITIELTPIEPSNNTCEAFTVKIGIANQSLVSRIFCPRFFRDTTPTPPSVN